MPQLDQLVILVQAKVFLLFFSLTYCVLLLVIMPSVNSSLRSRIRNFIFLRIFIKNLFSQNIQRILFFRYISTGFSFVVNNFLLKKFRVNFLSHNKFYISAIHLFHKSNISRRFLSNESTSVVTGNSAFSEKVSFLNYFFSNFSFYIIMIVYIFSYLLLFSEFNEEFIYSFIFLFVLTTGLVFFEFVLKSMLNLKLLSMFENFFHYYKHWVYKTVVFRILLIHNFFSLYKFFFKNFLLFFKKFSFRFSVFLNVSYFFKTLSVFFLYFSLRRIFSFLYPLYYRNVFSFYRGNFLLYNKFLKVL